MSTETLTRRTFPLNSTPFQTLHLIKSEHAESRTRKTGTFEILHHDKWMQRQDYMELSPPSHSCMHSQLGVYSLLAEADILLAPPYFLHPVQLGEPT